MSKYSKEAIPIQTAEELVANSEQNTHPRFFRQIKGLADLSEFLRKGRHNLVFWGKNSADYLHMAGIV
jgi:hypothetical protein